MNSMTANKELLAPHLGPVDGRGHQAWTGKVSRFGAPLLRLDSRDHSAFRLIFEHHNGRKPVGLCRTGCDKPRCVAPGHIEDDLIRRDLRLKLRALYGHQTPWLTCPAAGHPWDEHGRIEPNLELYCRACNTVRARATRNPTTIRKDY